MSNITRISVRTKSGAKVHLGSPGSSVTACGRWMKTDGRNMQVEAPVDCDRCGKANPEAVAEVNGSADTGYVFTVPVVEAPVQAEIPEGTIEEDAASITRKGGMLRLLTGPNLYEAPVEVVLGWSAFQAISRMEAIWDDGSEDGERAMARNYELVLSGPFGELALCIMAADCSPGWTKADIDRAHPRILDEVPAPEQLEAEAAERAFLEDIDRPMTEEELEADSRLSARLEAEGRDESGLTAASRDALERLERRAELTDAAEAHGFNWIELPDEVIELIVSGAEDVSLIGDLVSSLAVDPEQFSTVAALWAWLRFADGGLTVPEAVAWARAKRSIPEPVGRPVVELEECPEDVQEYTADAIVTRFRVPGHKRSGLHAFSWVDEGQEFREVHGGPMVPGPYLGGFEMATVISRQRPAHPISRPVLEIRDGMILEHKGWRFRATVGTGWDSISFKRLGRVVEVEGREMIAQTGPDFRAMVEEAADVHGRIGEAIDRRRAMNLGDEVVEEFGPGAQVVILELEQWRKIQEVLSEARWMTDPGKAREMATDLGLVKVLRADAPVAEAVAS